MALVAQQESKLIDMYPGDILLHKKGMYYKVLDMGIDHHETHEEMVTYQALYGSKKKWSRQRRLFTEDRFQVVIKGEDL